jgi:hypothetical protein
MSRKPKGYLGVNHTVIGSDMLAVLNALQMPEHILSETTMEHLRHVKSDEFYPVAWFLDLMEELDHNVGRFGLVRLGRKVFELSHQERVLKVANSARDIVYGIDGMYQHAHRGKGIGGWQVTSFEPGRAQLVKNTPHHCIMEEGILLQALFAVGAPSRIEQQQCFRRGASACIYEITSVVVDERWMGTTS